MLILIGQIASSQTVVIDTLNKTITLDRAKKIEVAKIILNESRLYQENQDLKDYIKTLEEENKKLSDKITYQEKEIFEKQQEIVEKQKEIMKDKDEIISIQKSKSSDGLYLDGCILTQNNGFGFGSSYVFSKVKISASYVPNLKIEKDNYKFFIITLGIKIF